MGPTEARAADIELLSRIIRDHLIPDWAIDRLKVEVAVPLHALAIDIDVCPLACEVWGPGICTRWQNLVSEALSSMLHKGVSLRVLVAISPESMKGGGHDGTV